MYQVAHDHLPDTHIAMADGDWDHVTVLHKKKTATQQRSQQVGCVVV